ncbi:hypothetical protein [Halopiger goleimassiliensis]|uniref:hypothetical protein n=1 Tax=Halopiger goleimassiliensis TaxID=1293048 RepID=UPI0006776EEA|nr:hypothetical protein [Halopiger goleimassiliensis]
MMLPTHALAGMVLAVPLVATAPELTPIGLIAGLLGGVVPDLDLYTGHRKTLHFPVYYSLVAAVGTVTALAVPTTLTVAAALFFLAAALHCVTDVFGSGLELRPWEGKSERAVYDHYRETWIRPRRAVRYDGSPIDLLLSIALATPLLVVFEGGLRILVLGALAVGFVYTVLRRALADVAATVVSLLPASVLPYVPPRYLDEPPSDRSV